MTCGSRCLLLVTTGDCACDSYDMLCCAALSRYVLSARTQDVVHEASGPSVKLEVGDGQGKLPTGRR
jgi:hypothetical protein